MVNLFVIAYVVATILAACHESNALATIQIAGEAPSLKGARSRTRCGAFGRRSDHPSRLTTTSTRTSATIVSLMMSSAPLESSSKTFDSFYTDGSSSRQKNEQPGIKTLADTIEDSSMIGMDATPAIARTVWFGLENLDKIGNGEKEEATSSLPSNVSFDADMTFLQRSTGTRIGGFPSFVKTVRQWEHDFHDALDIGIDVNTQKITSSSSFEAHGTRYVPKSTVTRVSITSPTSLIVNWNITYVTPKVQWLHDFGTSCGWTPTYNVYNDRVGIINTFSYTKVIRLFADAIQTGYINIPLACIEGSTRIEISSSSTSSSSTDVRITSNNNIRNEPNERQEGPCIVSMTEDLAYSQDLQRGALQNRICGQDLQFFLETARRPHDVSIDDWILNLPTLLTFASVPGLTDPLSIEANADEDRWVPTIFLGIVAVTTFVFASLVAPEIIGQSILSTTPNYIVPPSERNDIIAY